jgi:hypothetical protein
VFLITIPKSGTWLTVEILKAYKLRFSNLSFIYDKGYIDHTKRFNLSSDPSIIIKSREQAKLLKKIEPNYFAVGHYPYYLKGTIKDFKKVFVCRDLRDAFASLIRMKKSWGNESTPVAKELRKFLEKVDLIIDWVRYDSSIFILRFEDILYSSRNEKYVIKKYLGKFLGIDSSKVNINDVFYRNIDKETLTYMGKKRSSYKDIWNDEFEDMFKECNGYEMNETLGYMNKRR